jgi:dTDP-4-dehydrorhamnose reductase
MSSAGNSILLFGAAGQVGNALRQRPAPPGFRLIGLTRAEVDITDRAAVLHAVERHRPAVIVNAAAYTAVDKAETDTQTAFAVNAEGARSLASAAREAGASIIQLSTDYVFDGAKASPYREDDAVGPMSAYGRSKEAGERAVRAANPRHVILRTAWVYAAHGNNFMNTMLRLGAERDVVRVVADQHGTPTAADDIADAVLCVAVRLTQPEPAFGTFHLTNSGRTTWYGFASRIFAAMAARGGRVPRLEAITTAEYPTPARRPAMSVLDCGKLAGTYGIRLRAWEEALDQVLSPLLGNRMAVARGAV